MKQQKVSIPPSGLGTKEGEISYETLEESPSHTVGLKQRPTQQSINNSKDRVSIPHGGLGTHAKGKSSNY